MALLKSSLVAGIGRGCAALAILFAWFVPPGHAAPAQQQEVQAVFVLNLTRFIKWPETAFPAEDAPLVICCLAGDPVGPFLVDAAKGEVAGKHPIDVRLVHSVEQFTDCQVAFFSKADIARVTQTITTLRTKPILMVGDSDGFLNLGGHVQLFNRGGQVKLRLALNNLKRSDLAASAPLLRVAEVIQD
ncbi:MAG TPA: YfiR family protein [Opitutaceae bacterium]|nr:YfiR family protein [Opitutaceae bacterium]